MRPHVGHDHSGGDLDVRTWVHDPQGPAVLISGTYQVGGEVSRRLPAALPHVLRLPGDAWHGPLPALLSEEVVRDQPGQEIVLDRLLDLLLITVLRAWFSRPEAGPPGWYATRSGPVVRPALTLLHDDPAHDREPNTAAIVRVGIPRGQRESWWARSSGMSDACGTLRFMDDELVGTQSPQRRMTDPEEALALLERAVPGLTDLRRPARAVIDWAGVEEGLGTPLPSDVTHLAEWYPTFDIGGFLLVRLPEPGEEDRMVHGTRDTLATLAAAWSEPGLGLPIHPAPGGLLPWGESCDSDKFMWRTTGPTPQDWVVTVASRGGAWWHYAGGAVQFLAEYCAGLLEPWGLPPIDLEVLPS
ncbi:cupin domain-containing protein [Streptomyces mexicanus]|uniref:cupin domain-containing protein n=1 Tax=Streptomyces mexicanus TaxID=178566 RepID=UPI0031EBE744